MTSDNPTPESSPLETPPVRTATASSTIWRKERITRRGIIGGAGVAAGAAAIGASALGQALDRNGSGKPGSDSAAALGQPAAATPQAGTSSGSSALVTSMRVPLTGVAADQVPALLQGAVTDWRAVGCPIPLPVSVVAIDGLAPDGAAPKETVADYAALVAALDKTPGAVASVPLDLIDARVNTLEVDGVNPLLATATDAEPVIRIGVAGDIIFGRNGGNYQRKYGDYTFPMLEVKDFLSTFDVTIANFECFVSDTIEPPELTDGATLDFVTPPDSLEGLVMAGIDAVSLANNHALYSNAGYGVEAFYDTVRHLTDAGIPSFGAGRDLDEARAPWVTEVNGLSIALYGVDGVTANTDFPGDWAVPVNVGATASGAGTNPMVLDTIVADVTALAGEHDIVIPFFHMGEQYLWTPRDWVVQVSRACIDAGATMMLSSHPHTIMGMEIYKDKPIFYSIGNFVYDQMFSVDTRTGTFLDLTVRGNRVVGIRVHGVEIVDFVQPRFMSAGEHASLMNRYWRSTDLRVREQGA